ncbi:MAG: hypothetical protein JAZ11_13905 [Candidatus Thiodiazotropha lotti]|nr:hypothetical protein [Candidatus Thiodiazotropha lotti]
MSKKLISNQLIKKVHNMKKLMMVTLATLLLSAQFGLYAADVDAETGTQTRSEGRSLLISTPPVQLEGRNLLISTPPVQTDSESCENGVGENCTNVTNKEARDEGVKE